MPKLKDESTTRSGKHRKIGSISNLLDKEIRIILNRIDKKNPMRVNMPHSKDEETSKGTENNAAEIYHQRVVKHPIAIVTT